VSEALKQAAGRILTMAEVAALTRTPENTLRYWRHLGDVGPRSYKIGRRVAYDEADVLAWLDEQRRRGGAA
jgi:predicted DNA-binding transcriptional regulator AlpA